MIDKPLATPRSSGEGRGRAYRSERGTAILEVALVMPLLLLLLFGIIIFGVDIGLKQNVIHAAAEAARESESAQITGVDNSSQCAAWTRVAKAQATTALNFLAQNNPTVVPSFSPGSGCSVDSSGNGTGTPAANTPIYLTVTITANSILQNMPGIGVVAPSQVSSVATVQVQ
ncbi:MAG: TadE/TadG family type IV pilus assembly protein [Acidimicrobiales bacterium]